MNEGGIKHNTEQRQRPRAGCRRTKTSWIQREAAANDTHTNPLNGQVLKTSFNLVLWQPWCFINSDMLGARVSRGRHTCCWRRCLRRKGRACFCVGDRGKAEKAKHISHHLPSGPFVSWAREDISKDLFGCQTKQMRQHKRPSGSCLARPVHTSRWPQCRLGGTEGWMRKDSAQRLCYREAGGSQQWLAGSRRTAAGWQPLYTFPSSSF